MPSGSRSLDSRKRCSSATAMFSGNPMPTKPVVATVSPSRMSCTASRAVTILPFSKLLRPWSNSRPCWFISAPRFGAAVSADHPRLRVVRSAACPAPLVRPYCNSRFVRVESSSRCRQDLPHFSRAALLGSLAILAGPGSAQLRADPSTWSAGRDGIKLHSEEIVDLHTTTPPPIDPYAYKRGLFSSMGLYEYKPTGADARPVLAAALHAGSCTPT